MSLSRRTFLVSAAAALGLALVPKRARTLIAPSSSILPPSWHRAVVIDWRAKRVLVRKDGLPVWGIHREGGSFTVHDLGCGLSQYWWSARQWGEVWGDTRQSMSALLVEPLPDYVLLGRREYADVRNWSFSGKDIRGWPPSSMFGMTIIQLDRESHFELALSQNAHVAWLSTLNAEQYEEYTHS